VLVKLGYGLIIPDYQGYGITADQIHPYLVMNLTAQHVIDMYQAVRPWLEAVDRIPDDPNLDLMGYSQGGATTMAVMKMIEEKYNNPDSLKYVSLHRVYAGGGPYDVQATYERFVTTDTAGYPVAVPLVMQGMILGNKLDIKMNELMQDWLYNNMDAWINSKKYTSAQLNQMIGTKVTHEILTPKGMDQTSKEVAELYKAMSMNSVVSYKWEPKASVYIMHSMDDETVPYSNATRARSKWSNSNITYNFGHYGGHVLTALRFIYSVQTLIQQEEKERAQYEQ
jgi:pimeloyl-ACP methyl ester carboxylesterase